MEPDRKGDPMMDYDTRSQEGYDEDEDQEVYAVNVTSEDSEWFLVSERFADLRELDGEEWQSDQCRNCGGSDYHIQATGTAAATVTCDDCGSKYWVQAQPASDVIF